MSLADLKRKLEPDANAAGKDAAPAKPIVVLIDDDVHVLQALRFVLQKQYDVRTSDRATVAADLVAQARPHVVILDIKMPEKSGFWVFEQIRTLDRDVPIIFNSAYQDTMDIDDALASYRPFAYLAKGDGARSFLAKVAEAVSWYEHHRKLEIIKNNR